MGVPARRPPHPGQFLDAGTLLTTLQGLDDAAHVDFAVPQDVASASSDLDGRLPFPIRVWATPVDHRGSPLSMISRGDSPAVPSLRRRMSSEEASSQSNSL